MDGWGGGGRAEGIRVPFSLFSRYVQRDNTDEPIVGTHSNLKYLNPFMGDFEQTVVKDGWSQVGPTWGGGFWDGSRGPESAEDTGGRSCDD